MKIPFENAEQLYYHRKWLYKYDGQKFVNLSFRKSFVQGWAVTWFDVWSKSCAVNLFETLPAIRCPVYFFAGANDHNTNYSITAQYFKKVKTPKKACFFLRMQVMDYLKHIRVNSRILSSIQFLLRHFNH